jgi:hypothetical protein
LDILGCYQDTITDAAFEHLKGIKVLNMSFCNQATITDAAVVHLKGIQKLYMRDCSFACIQAARCAGLPFF